MEFQKVTPESVGVPSQAVLDLIDRLAYYGIDMHCLMLLRHGKVYAQGFWKPYNPQTPHIMFSFSKSLTSTAIGFAVQEGKLSLDDTLCDIFPDLVPENPSENLKKCCVRHLLMMGCGHAQEIDWTNSPKDWISLFLKNDFVYEPGTHFLYNTAGTNLLSAILTRKTGQTLTQFLKPRLFEPLGMGEVHCHALADGTEMGGAGMYLTLDAMARFVQFVANRGSWEGKQLLRESWFDLATSQQIANPEPGFWAGDPDWHAGYGFQFWMCDQPGVFRGDGAFGQYGLVLTHQDAVVVIQSASMRLQKVLNAVWETLLPAFADGPLPEDSHSCHRLEKALARLEVPPMLGMRNPGGESSLNGAVYLPDQPIPELVDFVAGAGHFVPQGGQLEKLEFRFNGEEGTMILHQTRGIQELDLGLSGHFAVTQVDGVPFGCNGRWRAHNKLELELRNTRMATGLRVILEFYKDKLTVTSDLTVPELGGLAGSAPVPVTLTLESGEVTTKTKMYWEQ